MSEKILKALMQLFAIIANPGSNYEDKVKVVESFLRRQINEDLVLEYLKTFETYYNKYQKKQKDKGNRVIPLSSVRVLKICTEINEELTQQQKVIVLVQLLEFVKTDSTRKEITEQEMEFIETVAETFFIPKKNYVQIKDFVLNSFEVIPNTDNLLCIDNNEPEIRGKAKFILSEHIDNKILIINVDFVNMYLFRYLGKNELYINSQLAQPNKVYVFSPGSSIRNRSISPIYYSQIIGYFNEGRFDTKILFEVEDISYRFPGGKFGLNDVSFNEESGRLVGIMGASGAGKSTLLNVLNGSNFPYTGSVKINGHDIHRESEKIEGTIGMVPQDDLLIEELTVYQNLYYNAKLCFDNYTEEQITDTCDAMLKSLGLYEARDIPVGNPLNQKISGGQRKRLNISLELIREPSVLFLDEPTSGLSSRDSENIMDLLKELTLKGKLVFVVIHQPSSDIFKMFDKLLILDTGGWLIYNGDPIESIIYFKSRVHHANWSESECPVCGNVNPEQIFNIIEANVVDEYGNLTKDRKITPKEWVKFYEKFNKEELEEEPPKELPEINFKTPNKLKQWYIFMKRDFLSKLTNTQYLVINFLEAPLLAFMLAFIVKNWDITSGEGYTLLENDNIPVFILMSVIVSIFIGLTVSAEEIIKDRKILKREKFLNLSWASYLAAKSSNLAIISAIQALSFVLIANSIIEIRGMYFEYWLVLFSVWFSSNILGLVISDSFKTVVTVYIIIPFLVIPQLILSGIMVKYEKLNPMVSSPTKIPIYGEVIHARWAYEALAVYTFKNNKYEKNFYLYQKAMSRSDFKKNYWLKELRNTLNLYMKYKDNPNHEERLSDYAELLYNEIKEEQMQNDLVKFFEMDKLKAGEIDEQLEAKLKKYFDSLRKYYIILYNKNNAIKDKFISDHQKTPAGRKELLDMKKKYFNENLYELVTNANEMQRIINHKNRLYQKVDPVYLDPKNNLIKAHFYAPRKKIFGEYVSTFWVNIIVLWLITALTYFVLYFRILKKFLDSSEALVDRINIIVEKKKKKKEKKHKEEIIIKP